jgi:hypothetical protein
MGETTGAPGVIDAPLMTVVVEVRERDGAWVVGARYRLGIDGLPVPELLELVAETVDELWAANSVGAWWSTPPGGDGNASS